MSAAPRVLVTDLALPDTVEEEAALAEVGAELVRASCTTEDEVIEAGRGARVLLVQWAPITRRVFESLPELGLVVRYGIGLDNVDLDAAAGAGVAVANVPDYCTEEVAEHAVALLLAVQRRLLVFDGLVRGGRWGEAAEVDAPRLPLAEQTVAVVGYGRVGRRVAEILRSFGAAVRVLDPLLDEAPAGLELARSVAELEGCHALTLHSPLTDGTRGLVDDRLLGLFAPGALLVDTARGGLVDPDALLRALESGRLAGAGLDTFDSEPLPPGHPVLSFPNVVVTPHVAWLSRGAVRRLQREVGREAALYLVGELVH